MAFKFSPETTCGMFWAQFGILFIKKFRFQQEQCPGTSTDWWMANTSSYSYPSARQGIHSTHSQTRLPGWRGRWLGDKTVNASSQGKSSPFQVFFWCCKMSLKEGVGGGPMWSDLWEITLTETNFWNYIPSISLFETRLVWLRQKFPISKSRKLPAVPNIKQKTLCPRMFQ